MERTSADYLAYANEFLKMALTAWAMDNDFPPSPADKLVYDNAQKMTYEQRQFMNKWLAAQDFIKAMEKML